MECPCFVSLRSGFFPGATDLISTRLLGSGEEPSGGVESQEEISVLLLSNLDSLAKFALIDYLNSQIGARR